MNINDANLITGAMQNLAERRLKMEEMNSQTQRELALQSLKNREQQFRNAAMVEARTRPQQIIGADNKPHFVTPEFDPETQRVVGWTDVATGQPIARFTGQPQTTPTSGTPGAQPTSILGGSSGAATTKPSSVLGQPPKPTLVPQSNNNPVGNTLSQLQPEMQTGATLALMNAGKAAPAIGNALSSLTAPSTVIGKAVQGAASGFPAQLGGAELVNRAILPLTGSMIDAADGGRTSLATNGLAGFGKGYDVIDPTQQALIDKKLQEDMIARQQMEQQQGTNGLIAGQQ